MTMKKVELEYQRRWNHRRCIQGSHQSAEFRYFTGQRFLAAVLLIMLWYCRVTVPSQGFYDQSNFERPRVVRVRPVRVLVVKS